MKTETQGPIFTPFETAEIPKLDDTLCYQDWGGTDHVIYYCWEHKQLNPVKGEWGGFGNIYQNCICICFLTHQSLS